MTKFPQIFAFYSFKGGVGRSMAVLNVAYALAAKGRHVLVLDMDLEAPGLSGFLHREKEIGGFARCDMVDLVSWASSASLPLDPLAFPPLSDYVVHVPREKLDSIPRVFSELGHLDIIPVNEDRDYYDRLAALAMGNSDQNDLVRIGSVLRAWLKSLRLPIDVPEYYGPNCERTAPYDYVLIDSRTGITETGGLCIGPLSDQLVILTALNGQNVEGTRNFLSEVGILEVVNPTQAEVDSTIEKGEQGPEPKPFLIVASPVPIGEIETKRERLERLEQALGRAAVKLSYHPQLALKESIFTRDYRDEYLAREYDELLQYVLRMASDGDDHDMLPPWFRLLRSPTEFHEAHGFRRIDLAEVSRLLPSSAEFREGLRRLLRSASARGSEPILLFLFSTTNFAEISDDTDYVLWDRVCRTLSNKKSPFRLNVINNLAVLLSQWSVNSTDSELGALRLEAAMSCYEQILRAEEASPAQKASALFNRGVTFVRQGEFEKAVADYTAVIQMTDAPAEWKANALINRGSTYGQHGESEKAAADFTAVIQMPDTTAEQKARALFNRGETFGRQDQFEKAVADYTALIQMPDAPAEWKANALINRGSTYGEHGDLEKAFTDYTALIQMPDATAEQKAHALLGRAATYIQQGEQDKASTENTAVIQMPDAAVEQKAKALFNRGWSHYLAGRYHEAIEDERQAIMLNSKNPLAHGNLAIALLVLGRSADALAAYNDSLALAVLKDLDAMTTDLRKMIEKHGHLPGSDEAMARLEARRQALSQQATDNDEPAPRDPAGRE